MFGTSLPGQQIIKIDTVKEITDRLNETSWSNKRNFTILGLQTKRNIHFFFKTKESLLQRNNSQKRNREL